MNGAQALIRTLVDAGVDVCFTNPGTSEMHFVAALDAVPEMRGVLGAVRGRGDRRGRRLRADGRAGPPRRCCTSARAWATGWPTCTTRAGRTPRSSTSSATTRPTTSGSTRRWSPTSTRWRGSSRGWVRRSAQHGRRRRRRGRRRSRRRRTAPGRVATLILPADVSWSEGGEPRRAVPRRRRRRPVADGRHRVRGGRAAQRGAVRAAARRSRAAASRAWRRPAGSPRPPAPGCWPRRSRRGSSAARACPPSTGSPTWPSWRRPARRRTSHLILAGARSPVSFFAYPGKPSELVPEGCAGARAGRPARRRARRAGGTGRPGRAAGAEPLRQPAPRPELPAGDLTPRTRPRSSARCCPRARSSSDEANTSGLLAARGDRGRAAARLAHADRRRDRPGTAGGHRRRRSPARTARCSPSRPTAAPCTRSQRCGRRPGRSSTSPR